MAKLAIKGHSTRGKEVIELLEMLGGKNDCKYGCDVIDYAYIINKHWIIDWELLPSDLRLFTLEEFYEKFPYKVGDNVTHSDYESPLEIVGMKWENDSIKYEVYTNDYGYWFSVDELQPYKEETMEEIKIDIPKGYEFAGVDDDNQQVVFTKIQPKYPKTYEECCDVLKIEYPYFKTEEDGISASTYKNKLIGDLKQLIICRDAYWKIYGEQMGLGKPWEPDWANIETDKYVIEIVKNTITIHGYPWNETNHLLAFPTEEMRDAFYENFNGLINETKELL